MNRLQFAVSAANRQCCMTRTKLLNEIDFLQRRLREATDALNRDENPSYSGIVQASGSRIDSLAAQLNAEIQAMGDLANILHETK